MKKRTKWSKNLVFSVAKKCKNRSQFIKEYSGAHRWAQKNNILEAVYKIIPTPPKKENGFWNYDRCKKEALKYKNRREFEKGSGGAYSSASKNGWLKEITSHMRNRQHDVHITDKELKERALKFNTRSDFNKKDSYAVKIARKRGIYNDIVSHMRVRGSRKKRGIYVYEFEDKTFYVGLTYDYDKRELEHENSKKSSIYKKIQNFDHYLIEYNEFLPLEDAQKEEERVLKEYIKKGWTPLNIAKTGSIGGGEKKWNEDLVINAMKESKNRKEFIEKRGGAYGWLKREKKEDLLDIYLPLKRKRWNLTLVKQEARKYNDKEEFRKHSGGAYAWAHKNNVFDKITSHMKIKRIKWDIQKAKSICSEYNSINDLLKDYPGIKRWAKKNNYWLKLTKHMRKRKPNKVT